MSSKIKFTGLLIVAAVVIILLIYASIKIAKMHQIYKEESFSHMERVNSVANRIRSGELSLEPEKLADYLEAISDRRFDYGIVLWFRKYLYIFILLFGSICMSAIFLEFKKTKMKSSVEGPSQ